MSVAKQILKITILFHDHLEEGVLVPLSQSSSFKTVVFEAQCMQTCHIYIKRSTEIREENTGGAYTHARTFLAFSIAVCFTIHILYKYMHMIII